MKTSPWDVRVRHRDGQSPQVVALRQHAVGSDADPVEVDAAWDETMDPANEMARVHEDVVRMMAFAGMSKDWSERHAVERWPDFAPQTEMRKRIHQIVTEAVAKAKADRRHP